jgi:hypothetical protein
MNGQMGARNAVVSGCARVVVALSLLACGGDAASAGSAGHAAAAGRPEAGATPKSAGSPAREAPPITCGSIECAAPANPLRDLVNAVPALVGLLPTPAACCLDAQRGACGMTSEHGLGCEPRAIPDSRCPGVDLSPLGAFAGALGGAVMAGCCIEERCGLDGALFGRGCVENDQARAALGAIPLLSSLANLPAAMSCNGTPLHPADAGSEDAGL